MIREAIATGDTIVQAFENACKEIGVETYEAKFEILKNPEKKLFGLFGGSPAQVRAYIKTEPAQAAVDYLQEILQKMNVTDTDVKIEESDENGAKLLISGQDIGFIIGHRGETLDALQYLSGLVANHVDNSYYRITLDVGNYREKRKETLERLGKRMAQRSVKNRRNFSLEPMNPYERRIIHTAVQDVEGAKSWSEGEENFRHVVIGSEGGESSYRNNRYDGRKRNNSGEKRYNDKKPTVTNKVVSDTNPSENKKDAGTTQLYGRIEVK